MIRRLIIRAFIASPGARADGSTYSSSSESRLTMLASVASIINATWWASSTNFFTVRPNIDQNTIFLALFFSGVWCSPMKWFDAACQSSRKQAGR